jgi:inorganic pyrophosphatase
MIGVTKAEDGDPLDEAQTYPAVVQLCRPVGIVEVEQKRKGKKEPNDRVFAVPVRSPLEVHLNDIRKLASRGLDDLEQFFRATNALENKELTFLGCQAGQPRPSNVWPDNCALRLLHAAMC